MSMPYGACFKLRCRKGSLASQRSLLSFLCLHVSWPGNLSEMSCRLLCPDFHLHRARSRCCWYQNLAWEMRHRSHSCQAPLCQVRSSCLSRSCQRRMNRFRMRQYQTHRQRLRRYRYHQNLSWNPHRQRQSHQRLQNHYPHPEPSPKTQNSTQKPFQREPSSSAFLQALLSLR